MDGEAQTNFLDAPVIDCKFLPSKKALQYRLNQTIDLIEKGDMDYARWHNWKGIDWDTHGERNDDICLVDGEWYRISVIRGLQKFVATWQSRKKYLMDDCRDLQRSIELAE